MHRSTTAIARLASLAVLAVSLFALAPAAFVRRTAGSTSDQAHVQRSIEQETLT